MILIVSASRRCDIPSFFGKWFVNRLKDGYVLIPNPYNAHRYSKAVLNPQTVDIIVFWTKNPLPFMEYLPQIDSMGYPYYFEFTLTPYGTEMERNLPDKEVLIDSFVALSRQLGSHRMVWRYDPIIIDTHHSIDYHSERFAYIASRLSGYTNRCVISFVDNYKSVARRMGKDPTSTLTLANVYKIAEIFSAIAKKNNMDIYTCAEKYNLEQHGIRHGACIDSDIIEGILGCKVIDTKDKNQRTECLCIESVDIGTYNCCGNGCSYCYALQNDSLAVTNIEKHNPLSPLLVGEINKKALITNKDMKSAIINQLSLF